MLKYRIIGVCGMVLAGSVSSGVATAQTCGGVYVVRTQDTLSGMAKTAYGSPQKWRVIYNANYKTIGANPTFIFPGQRLKIPCANGKAPRLRSVRKQRSKPVDQEKVKVRVVNTPPAVVQPSVQPVAVK
ncbi:MAG TPA: LysM peptidoglycan-binding domain-containing protein, partial [Rhizobiales bacterium]|nr:LysM peptidoglycan-binding domain-containing protein [Hyphomicrobiales bacterium]